MDKVQTTISFEDIKFSDSSDNVKATFMKNYYFFIPKEKLSKISTFSVEDGNLFFAATEKKVWNKFNLLLNQGFDELHHKVRDKKTLYIHKNSEIPLIGSNEFGLIDRGSNIIEVKPLTGCNLSCTFCSVDEGVNNKTDIVVEEEYLVAEFKKLCSIKKYPVEANIGPQGEPLLYPKTVELVRDLKENGASVVSINTNGTMLYPKLIDELAQVGLDRINLSLHSLVQKQVNEIMGGVQNVQRIIEMISYCKDKIDVLLAPVLLPGVTDDQLDKIIKLSKTITNKKWPTIGIQNFLEYPGGRNPGLKQRSWEDFFSILKEKEKEHQTNLTLKGAQNIFEIHAEETLPKPFRKGEIVEVSLKAKGRNKNEWLGVSNNRVVTVKNFPDARKGDHVKVKLLRDKHNIFTGITP